MAAGSGSVPASHLAGAVRKRNPSEKPKTSARSRGQLEVWYRALRLALDAGADDRRCRILVETLLHALRGRPPEAIVVDGFVLALAGAKISPHLVAAP